MSDTKICRKVLEKILTVPIKNVEFPVTRKTTDIVPDCEDVRLDACVQQTFSPLVKAIHKRVTELKLDNNMELQYINLLQKNDQGEI